MVLKDWKRLNENYYVKKDRTMGLTISKENDSAFGITKDGYVVWVVKYEKNGKPTPIINTNYLGSRTLAVKKARQYMRTH